MSQSEKLAVAFTNALGISPQTDFDTVAYGKTEGWDSVAHMTLIAEIESVFDIMLETDEVIGMSSFPVAKTILEKHGVSFK